MSKKAMDRKFDVVRMTPDHIDALVKIAATGDEPFWNAETFKRHITARYHGGYVAFDGLNPVGFVAHERVPSSAYIVVWNLVVMPEYRKKGVASELLKSLMGAVPCEFDGVRFNVRESNTLAHLLLKKLGFWCEAISRDFFIDYLIEGERKEDAFCFDYNPSKPRSKDDPLRIVSRTGAVLHGPPPSCGRDPFYVTDGNRHRQSKAG